MRSKPATQSKDSQQCRVKSTNVEYLDELALRYKAPRVVVLQWILDDAKESGWIPSQFRK